MIFPCAIMIGMTNREKRSDDAVDSPDLTRAERPKRSRSLGHVSVARDEQSAGLSERRRLRRLKKAQSTHSLPPVVTPRTAPLQIYISTRWMSAFLVVLLLAVLALFLSRDVFYVNVIYVGGTRYLSPAEIFARTKIDRKHIFAVNPAAVEEELEADPAIADAEVQIGWPPSLVQITITEREPALVWEQAGKRVWVDIGGHVMEQREDLSSLVRVVVEKPSEFVARGGCPQMGMDLILSPGSCIAPPIVAGALQFKALYPNVAELVYDPAKGLGYHHGGGWVLWFGDGSDITVKMAINDKIVKTVFEEQRKQLVEVNVVDPDAPYYTLAPGSR